MWLHQVPETLQRAHFFVAGCKRVTFSKKNEYAVQAIFTIVEYSLVSTFIYLSLSNPFLKKVILFISILFLTYAVINFVRTDKKQFDSIPSSIEDILIIAFCIFYLFEQISKPEITFIYASPNFWIVLAFLVYMSATLFLFIITSSLSQEEKNKYWIINHISNTITNIFLSIAFINNRKKKPEEPVNLDADFPGTYL